MSGSDRGRPEMLLPEAVRTAACRSGREWGWRPEFIPRVINEAETSGLLNVGGQLQFLMPEGTCECYWVEVDALIGAPVGLAWTERVALAAVTARRKMAEISDRYDFLEEGRKAYPASVAAYEAAGGNLRDRMCFIWYLEARQR